MSSKHYDRMAIFLHWFIAIGIVLLFFLEVIRQEWPKGTFMRDGLKALHNPVGTVLFAVILFRIAWWLFVARTIHDDKGPTSGLEMLAARMTKLVLYAMMVAIPVSGMLYVFGRGRVIDFGIFEIGSSIKMTLPKSEIDALKDSHEWLGWAILVLAGVHALAALWHHYVRHDNVLRRMLPALKGNRQ